jgi:hypothetical protein
MLQLSHRIEIDEIAEAPTATCGEHANQSMQDIPLISALRSSAIDFQSSDMLNNPLPWIKLL